MISNRDIIIFNDDWGRFPSTLQHVARVLLNNKNRVFWIGSLGLRRPKINYSDFLRALQKISKVFLERKTESKTNEIAPIQIDPLVIPLHDIKIIRCLNTFTISRKIKKVLKRYKANNPILITSAPITHQLVGRLNETCSIYYCVDDYSKMEDAFRSLAELEKKLVEKVDGVFAVSDYLFLSRKPKNSRSYFAPQGVDTDHFTKTMDLADEVKKINRPVIGFFGLIAAWVDLDLIYDCVNKYPDYTFVLIGKTDRDLSRFYKCKNFLYLGAVEYKYLPRYASAFDAGLIPFELKEVTLAANPLKLLEYFSLGIPVVSTNLPEAKKFSSLAFVAGNRTEFISMIELAVNDNNEESNRKRIEKAKEYSWNSITEKIFDIVLNIESEKLRHS